MRGVNSNLVEYHCLIIKSVYSIYIVACIRTYPWKRSRRPCSSCRSRRTWPRRRRPTPSPSSHRRPPPSWRRPPPSVSSAPRHGGAPSLLPWRSYSSCGSLNSSCTVAGEEQGRPMNCLYRRSDHCIIALLDVNNSPLIIYFIYLFTARSIWWSMELRCATK